MIRLDCPQGSQEWHEARLGIPTSSEFDRILTPKTGKLSAGADKYINEKIAEWATGQASNDFVSDWMERGHELEPQAVAFYEMTRDVETETVGFLMTDDGMVGCSPDRLVGDDGGLEIKCPAAATHVGYLRAGDGDNRYRTQVQGSLWVSGREWWDFLSFHPSMPPALVRFHRDEEFIAKLASAVGEFVDKLQEAREQMVKLGFTGRE